MVSNIGRNTLRMLTKTPEFKNGETIFLTSEADDSWEIYTFNTARKKKLKQKALEHPALYKQIAEDGDLGYVRYEVHKSKRTVGESAEIWSASA